MRRHPSSSSPGPSVTNRRTQTLIGVIGVATGVGFTIMISGVMEGSQRQFVGTWSMRLPHITITDERLSVALQPAEQVYGAAQRSSFTATDKRPGISNSNLMHGLAQELAAWDNSAGSQGHGYDQLR